MKFILNNKIRSPKLDRGDKLLIWAFTLLYAVFAMLNLGTLSFPETVWDGSTGGEVIFDFGREVPLQDIWLNANIGEGTVTFTADDGTTLNYEQKYGSMFYWQVLSAGVTTQKLTLQQTAGNTCFNELAFFDMNNSRLIPQTVSDSGAELVDEQNTVPKMPSYFTGMYFDEIYHARTAYEFIHGLSIYEWTHPPLGKLIICIGVLIFGMKPFGWRVMPALFGALMLPVLFALAKRLFRRRDYAFLAAALFALDTLHFAQTRIATVDVFIVFFILLMALFMVDFLMEDYLHTPLKKLLLPLGLCGLSFGLGVASKWTGLYAGLGLAVAFFSQLAVNGIAAKRNGEQKLFWKRSAALCAYCCGVFLLIPALIYFLSYIPFYLYDRNQLADPSSFNFRSCIDLVIRHQKNMYGYHSNLESTHPSQSAWFEWPLAVRSVWFFIREKGGKLYNISSGGSPAVWWVSCAGTLCLMVEAAFGGLKKASAEKKNAAVFLGIMLLANYLPWLGVSRCVFQYHFFPSLPFMLLAGILLLQHLEEQGSVKPWLKWVWLGFAAVYFILLLPTASGLPISRSYANFVEHYLPTGNIFHGYL